MRSALLIVPAIVLICVAIYYLVIAWNIVPGGTRIGSAGYIAMVLGVIFALALGAVLVTLLLRRGPDGG